MRFLPLLILAIAVLAGCVPRAAEGPQTYRSGTQGLTLQFTPNLPPTQLYDDQELNVVVEVENRGATDVGAAGDRVYISGFDPSIITGIPTQGIPIPLLEGKGPYRAIGDKDFIAFKGILRKLAFRNVDRYTPRLQATACYGYSTIAQGNICIDPDPYSAGVKQKVCTPQAVGLGSQGAPVTVSSIDIEPAPGTSRFKITITNAGGGEVFRNGATYLSKCAPNHPQGLAFTDIDRVQVHDVRIGDVSILPSCKPVAQGHLYLTNGQGTLYCQLNNVRGSSAYVTPITVELRYGYRTTITRDVTIIQSS